ncbi:MAG TPA: CdaR family protein [Verrucomicrobiae bacterium]|jgi:YbbR domain-containing protein|nr:CdaR family protein [Verrucomicrobiae bacterium]
MIVFVRNLVVKDFWLKLFSLVLAILIWLTVQFSISKEVSPLAALIGRAVDEKVLAVPLDVPPVDGRTVTVDPAQVQVTLRGDPKLLKSIGAEDIRAIVDLSGVEAADGLSRRVQLILPPGISYTQLTPDAVEVRVSPRN